MTLENEVEFIRHGGDIPFSQTEAEWNSVAQVSCDDMDGYSIPHEDIYDVNDDEDWLKDDPEYQKACAAAAGNVKESSTANHSSKKENGSPHKKVTAASGWGNMSMATLRP